ncbi:ArsB/NhaD family transporter [Paenibacillus athensensis]|uniref:Citrate transporter-like domain-containing protein n=1 Tax=Paenibacillus athensensis TaxID=1967502 RepID=A0A4Y8PSI3_9BACL|nr:ArsB/NhaD family transporter [Paenibacillus athensensis]MCD1260762.1 ArsB/NhaD family transporter [Paenibacillus athensensis]
MLTWLALAIFFVTYALIISEKINRAVVALAGAALMVFAGILDVHKAFTEYIEWGTITLLVGMMILVGIASKTGVFAYVAVRAAKWAKGEPLRILLLLSALTAVGSALLDNVTTVLLVVPVTFSITRLLGVNPVPYLLAEIIASNIGGTATLIGDPPNIMIGSANPHLTFNAFLVNLGPITVLILAVTLLYLYLIYKKQLTANPEQQKALMAIDEKELIQDRPLMRKSLIVLALTLLGFVLHAVIHVDAAVVAVSGAILLMLIGLKEHEVEEAFDAVEWVTIFFFAGLFALVGGLQQVGIIRTMAEKMLEITGGDTGYAAGLILWGSGIASATIDNIPFVATMIPLIRDMADGLGLAAGSPQIDTLWWSLALGACLGGNGTIIGASANVIVAGLAAKEGKSFSYWEFLKVGAPITILSLLMAHVYIYIRYLL